MLMNEQQGHTIDTAPMVKINAATKARPPKKNAITQVVSNVVDTVAKGSEVAGGTVEAAISLRLDKVTKEEINTEWVPYYLKTGNFKILNQRTKGKSKSFLVDLRTWGFMNTATRNYFYDRIKSKKETHPKHFKFIQYLAANPPRSQAEALQVPDNINKIDLKRDKWAQKAIKVKKKYKKPGYFDNWAKDAKALGKEIWGSLTKGLKETKVMKNDDIRALIKEAFTDKVYGQYPYSHKAGDEQEPQEDYVEEWKRFCLEIIQDKSKSRAIALAKILIKDVELFEDVLDLAGQNQSVGSEILRKMQKEDDM